MAGEQTALILSGTSCPVNVVVNAIDSSGSHIALVIDTTTTRIDNKTAVPSVYYPSGSTGIAEIRFSLGTGVAEGDVLILKVNGTAGGTAFSEYAIPVRVVGSSSLTSAETWKHDVSLFTLLPSSYAGHKLVDIETAVTTNIPANIAALNDFDPATTQVDVGKINGDSTSASNLQKSTSQIIQGSVSVSNLTPTSNSFASSSITESTADHYKGRIVIFTSGNLSGQATDITAYSLSSGEGVFSVSQMTEAPSSSDTFVIV